MFPHWNDSGNPGMPFGMWHFGEDDSDYLMENSVYCTRDEDGRSFCTLTGPGIRDMLESFKDSDGMWFHDMFDDSDDMSEDTDDMDEMHETDDLDGSFDGLDGFSSSGEFCFGDNPVTCVDLEDFSGLSDGDALGEMLFGLLFGLGDGESGLSELFEMFDQLAPEAFDEALEEEPAEVEEEEAEEAEEVEEPEEQSEDAEA